MIRQLGQFTSKDTWLGRQTNPLSQNRNTFVENNPINNVDPSGNVPLSCFGEDFECKVANSVDRTVYYSNGRISENEASARAVQRYAQTQTDVTNYYNRNPGLRYTSNNEDNAKKAALEVQERVKRQVQSSERELEALDPAVAKQYQAQYGNQNLSQAQRLEIIRKIIQVCRDTKTQEIKAQAAWDAKPWWEKVGSFVTENWAAIALTVVAVIAITAAVVLTGGVVLAAASAGIAASSTTGVSVGAAVGFTIASSGGTLLGATLLATGGAILFGESNNHTSNKELREFNENGMDVSGKVATVSGLLSLIASTSSVANSRTSNENSKTNSNSKNPENSKNAADYQRLKEQLKDEQLKATNDAIKERNTYSTADEARGRTTIATTRAESDAMNKALNNPSSGEVLDTVVMSDSRGGYYAKDGWVKMQITVSDYGGKGSVHYIYNTKTGESTDFKFADTK